jgi:hypothetical protein
VGTLSSLLNGSWPEYATVCRKVGAHGSLALPRDGQPPRQGTWKPWEVSTKQTPGQA